MIGRFYSGRQRNKNRRAHLFCFLIRKEDLLHMKFQQSRNLHGQFQGGVIFVIFDRNDRLPADSQFFCEIFLPQACLFSQLFDDISHRAYPFGSKRNPIVMIKAMTAMTVMTVTAALFSSL